MRTKWRLWTRKDGYLSISPTSWTTSDLSAETQVTIVRSERISHSKNDSWKNVHWPKAYPKCKQVVAEVVKRAVAGTKKPTAGDCQPNAREPWLRLRESHHRQFEILSADFMIDEEGKVWLFEFNVTPVLRDQSYDAIQHGNDWAEITEAMRIAVPVDGS